MTPKFILQPAARQLRSNGWLWKHWACPACRNTGEGGGVQHHKANKEYVLGGSTLGTPSPMFDKICDYSHFCFGLSDSVLNTRPPSRSHCISFHLRDDESHKAFQYLYLPRSTYGPPYLARKCALSLGGKFNFLLSCVNKSGCS